MYKKKRKRKRHAAKRGVIIFETMRHKLSKTINELADLPLGTVLSLPALAIPSLINYSAARL